MESILLALQGAVSQGVLWGILALGVYITFRILDIADMSVDGSFVTGAAVSSVLILNGVSPFIAILSSIVAGIIAGLLTGILITKFEIPSILAGILTQLALYSINLRIMGRSNIPLLRFDTIYSQVASILNVNLNIATLIVGLVLVVLVITFLYWFFGTEIGSTIRATGNNEKMVSAQGISLSFTKTLGLMLGNGLIGLSGSLVSQSQGYVSVTMGVGSIVIGIASIVIGEVFFSRDRSFATRFISIIVGSIIYRMIIALALQLGLNTDDLKLITAFIVVIALSAPIVLAKYSKKKAYLLANKEDQ